MHRFFICKHCNNILGLIHNSGVPMVCCGEVMSELEPNTQEAATEKHLPVVERDGNLVRVKVGSVAHPMTEDHSIVWVYLETEQGGQRKALKDTPETCFALTDDDQPVAAYAFCNLHGLWKTSIK